MRYLKKYKLFESVSEETVRDILLDITDDSNFNVDIKEVDNHLEVFIKRGSYLDSRKTREIPGAPSTILGVFQKIKRPPSGGYPANVFLWFEIKDTIIRLCEYVYAESGLEPIENKPFQQWYLQQEHFAKSPFRMKNSAGSGEFGIGWHKAEDFTLDDFTSFTGLKLIIKL